MTAALRHQLKPRRVQFEFQDIPLHWLPDDPFSSHVINGINMLLPAGELWFCRVYNKALPLITDPQLRADVEGFIRQEAIHSRSHSKAEQYLMSQGLETDEYRAKAEWLFEQFLGEAPFGVKALQQPWLEKRWVIARVGVIAAIEHFTGVLGQWCMDNTSWDRGHPVMVDLFRWHLAEEVEHRNVAYDLFRHLCETELGFYVSRQALMAIIFPLFLYYLAEGGRSLAKQDQNRYSRWLARQSVARLMLELERVGTRTQNVPTFTFLVKATLRWMAPGFHPEHEGDTAQALAYLARSPAARAAAEREGLH
ncbi:MAG TPA: metal-dependent hydrolase [Moraxellaceae bacterium]|nr:metal-dependent hydrolase [Moraxellaceae bacterium]